MGRSPYPIRKSFWSMKCEYMTCARLWVEPIGKMGLLASGFIDEGERPPPCRQVKRKSCSISDGLRLDSA